MWMQRRVLIADLIRKFKPRSILELGCGEGNILGFFGGDPLIHRIVGIDINESALKESLLRLQPTTSDIQFPREAPLEYELYQGSILDLDDFFSGFDVCICSEVIEHIRIEELDSFARAIFSVLKPRVLVLTTPNSEFNCLFPNYDGSFRDEDHKFEWTRKEFQEWCISSIEKYSADLKYDVSFHGVGIFAGSTFNDSKGHCSQAALFVSKNNIEIVTQQRELSSKFKLVGMIKYPFFRDDNLTDEIRMNNILSWIPTVLKWKDQNCQDFCLSYEELWKIHKIRQHFAGDFDAMKKLVCKLGGDIFKEDHVFIAKDSPLRSSIVEEIDDSDHEVGSENEIQIDEQETEVDEKFSSDFENSSFTCNWNICSNAQNMAAFHEGWE